MCLRRRAGVAECVSHPARARPAARAGTPRTAEPRARRRERGAGYVLKTCGSHLGHSGSISNDLNRFPILGEPDELVRS